MKRTPVTVVIPTLNEGWQIADCVRQLAWAAEVIVVDGGSTDDTAAAARGTGATVLEARGVSIAAQRNAGIAAASHEWVFALDADERVSAPLAAEIDAVVRAPAHQTYAVKRRNVLHGRVATRGHWGRDWVVRLFRRGRRFEDKLVHEGLDPGADWGRLRNQLDHIPYRDMDHHVQKMLRWSRLGAVELAARGRRARWVDLALRPASRFWRQLLLHGGLLDGRLGLVEAGMGAMGVFCKYLFLWDLNRRSDG